MKILLLKRICTIQEKNHQFEKNCTKKSFKKIPKITRPKTNFLTSSEKKKHRRRIKAYVFIQYFLFYDEEKDNKEERKKKNEIIIHSSSPSAI